MRLPVRSGLFLLFLAALLPGCKSSQPEPEPIDYPEPTQPLGTSLAGQPAAVANNWASMSLRLAAHTPGNTPTYASRAFGYLGLGMYEATVYGLPNRQSLMKQLNRMPALPQPETGQTYDWSLALNACQHVLHQNLYSHTLPENLAAVDSLEAAQRTDLGKNLGTPVVDRSVAYGRAIGQALYDWSKTDGGHEGFKDPFPTSYNLPNTAGTWSPPLDGQVAVARALHPDWGRNRTFIPANADLPLPKPLDYSTSPTSDYYKMYRAVYDTNKQLTQAQKEAAIWWSDDPSQTFTPPGHSYNLARIAVRTANADLAKAIETYARVGMAVADAFVCCFRVKYTYVNERPSSYVRANIDRSWLPFWPEPPFPAFTSGHSTQGAATATVLTDLYGEGFRFTDNSHAGRPRDTFRNVDFTVRQFNSFQESAEESGQSRIWGGIHTRQDNEVGLSEGRKIGRNINQLAWMK